MTASIDLDNQLSGADAGGTWSQVGTSPAAATIAAGNTVDFTDLANGTYTFRYSVGEAPCTPLTSDIEIMVRVPADFVPHRRVLSYLLQILTFVWEAQQR